MIFSTLATIHNLQFTIALVDQMRAAMAQGDFYEFKEEWIGRFTRGIYSK